MSIEKGKLELELNLVKEISDDKTNQVWQDEPGGSIAMSELAKKKLLLTSPRRRRNVQRGKSQHRIFKN